MLKHSSLIGDLGLEEAMSWAVGQKHEDSEILRVVIKIFEA